MFKTGCWYGANIQDMYIYIYIHLSAFLNLFDRSVCCYHLAFVPKQNPRDTSTWKGSNSVWRLFGWSPKKLPVVEANLAIEKAFWPQTQLNPPQRLETFSVCITLELASTCSPGRWSQLCKQKRYNSSRLLQVGGRTKSITLLASTKIQPPGSILVGRVREKKKQAQAVLLFRYLKSNAGCILHNQGEKKASKDCENSPNANKWACSGQQHSNTLSPRQTSKFQQHMSHKGPNRSSKEPNTSSNLLIKQQNHGNLQILRFPSLSVQPLEFIMVITSKVLFAALFALCTAPGKQNQDTKAFVPTRL